MKVKYLENNDLAIFDDKKFRRDKVTGYYLNSNIRKRLHVYVWEYHNGIIPKEYHVHHIKGKEFNDIENLELVHILEHSKIHNGNLSEKEKELRRNNLITNAVPVAAAKKKEWAKTKEGQEWLKNNYFNTLAKIDKINFTCEFCGEIFESKPNNRNRFCSNKFKSAWRRKEGLDNEIRICDYCKQEFTVNKYSKAKTCSRSCSNRLTPRLPQLKNK